MSIARRSRWLPAALAVLAAPSMAKPVFIAETPGKTRFFIDDASLSDLPQPGGSIRQATVLSRNAPDPQLKTGQVAAEGIMQFNCAAQSWRQWSTTSVRKDGSRQVLVTPSPTRSFTATREGSFERKLLQAACAMRKAP